ncbi:MAG: GIY-YIG nuclease family protein [Clostridia bacterium]|jgi:hypothetical protein|nr:GIY-YIG nuclease family protein [Clostridia bacterium]
MDRRKELKLQYKQMKPEMGVIIIRSELDNKCYLEGTQNIKGTINSAKFKLEAGIHPNRELQRAWKEQGEKNFLIQVLENLEYEEDESKTDYSEELALLEMVWTEKLAKNNMEFYQK